MYESKNVLLIAGGGTLGRYTAAELLRLGCYVDILCLEDNVSAHERLRYYKGNADLAYLKGFLKDRQYHGIVNFIHYKNVEEYKPVHRLLSESTEHLIFLSSYRVYADLEHPITENSPTLYDTVKDEDFLQNENYAVPKSKAERYLKSESGTKNWTIVRPVISFSDKRLDIVTVSGRKVIECAKAGKTILLPEQAKNLTAGLDWAGNSGKLIANLLFKEKALGEIYTISTAQNMLWKDVAAIYTQLLGAEFEWIDANAYAEKDENIKRNPWILKYDRLFDRKIDNRKVLEITGLQNEEFLSIRDGIQLELDKIIGKRADISSQSAI